MIENQENDQNEIPPFVLEFFDKLKKIKENIPPEKQYAFSAYAAWMSMALLVNPEIFPDKIQPLIELIDYIPLHQVSLWLQVAGYFLGAVDGAKRIAIERLPFYKAYIQVFLLSNFDQED